MQRPGTRPAPMGPNARGQGQGQASRKASQGVRTLRLGRLGKLLLSKNSFRGSSRSKLFSRLYGDVLCFVHFLVDVQQRSPEAAGRVTPQQIEREAPPASVRRAGRQLQKVGRNATLLTKAYF